VCNGLDVGLGIGWNFATSVVLWDPNSSRYTLLGRDSSVTTFRPTPTGAWVPSAGGHFELEVFPGEVVVRHKSGTRFAYQHMTPAVPLPGAPFLLTAIQDRNGLTTTYTYSAGRLTQIADPYGRTIALTHYPDGTSSR
jgi:hypothetical protein